jgi:hypothetical protein
MVVPGRREQFGLLREGNAGSRTVPSLLQGAECKHSVRNAIQREFGPNGIATAEPDTVRAVRGACDAANALAAGAPDQNGAYCLAVGFQAGVVSHVALRQVVPGDAEKAALRALQDRYGRSLSRLRSANSIAAASGLTMAGAPGSASTAPPLGASTPRRRQRSWRRSSGWRTASRRSSFTSTIFHHSRRSRPRNRRESSSDAPHPSRRHPGILRRFSGLGAVRRFRDLRQSSKAQCATT